MKKNIFLCCLIINILITHAQTVEELKETSAVQSRELSLPESRIVINPFDYLKPNELTQSAYSNHPSLPLKTGYLSTEKVSYRVVSNILNIYRYEHDASVGEQNYLWTADLTDVNKWVKQSQSNLEITATGLKFSLTANPTPVYKYFRNATPITIDFDKNPILLITVSDFSGTGWSLKMRDENDVEKVLRNDAPGNGTFEFSMKDVSGWTGSKNITFYLFCIGGSSIITVNDWGIVSGVDTEFKLKEASAYSTEWMPNELPFNAQYADGSSLNGTDFFYDVNTIVRRVQLTESGSSNNKFILSGAYEGQTVTFEDNVLIQNKGVYSIAITANAFENFPVKFYDTSMQMKMQINGKDNPSKAGYWSVQLDASQLDNDQLEAVAAYSYANDSENNATLKNRAKAPLAGNNVNSGYDLRKNYWNDYLAKVPHPSVFNIEVTQDKGVTGEDVKKAYYKAWTYIASNLLKSDPVKYPYPQVVTGKGSMWDAGHDLSPYSATWESFFGIQFLAFTDPENAWKAFEGIMSLTDAQGLIGGESLPSRKAQTAWILYKITGDTDRLSGVYDELERYLNWRMIYPHWILPGHAGVGTQDPTKKDAEFVFSAIVDMFFMAKISKVVKDDAVAAEWEQKGLNFYTQCLPWFWETPTSQPMQNYNTATGQRSPGGNRYWVTSGLFMDLLQGDYLQSMLNDFSSNFSHVSNFGGSAMGLPKFPDVSYTAYGLIEKGQINRAERVIDACLRDIVRSGAFFAEQYNTWGEPYPAGVRPSLFGACMMIDFVMIKNGFRYDSGYPIAVNAFNGERSISNIRYGEDILNISRNASGEITVTGSYVNETYSIPSERGDYFIVGKEGFNTSIPESVSAKKKEKPFTVFSNNGEVHVRFNINFQPVNISLKLIETDGKTVYTVSPSAITLPITIFPVPQHIESTLYVVVAVIDGQQYAEKLTISQS